MIEIGNLQIGNMTIEPSFWIGACAALFIMFLVSRKEDN